VSPDCRAQSLKYLRALGDLELWALQSKYPFVHAKSWLNPLTLTPSDAVRKQKNIILENLFSSVLSQFEKFHTPRNLKFNYLGISQSLKLRITLEKNSISLKLNFTSNTLGCYGLKMNKFPSSKLEVSTISGKSTAPSCFKPISYLKTGGNTTKIAMYQSGRWSKYQIHYVRFFVVSLFVPKLWRFKKVTGSNNFASDSTVSLTNTP